MIDLGGAAQGVAVHEGFVWVGLHHASAVARIDPSSNTVADRIETGDRPGSLVAGGGAVWVANYSTGPEGVSVSRIDAASGKVTGEIGAPDLPDLCCDMGLDESHLWVPTAGAGALVAVDVRTVRRADLFEPDVEGVEGAVSAGGKVWIGDGRGAEAAILGIDPASGEVVERIDIGASAVPVMADGDRVWGLTATGVVAFDAANGDVLVEAPVEVSQAALAVGEGAVWVVGTSAGAGILYRLDPADGRVLGSSPAGETPSRVATGEGSVWVTDFDGGALLRFEPV